MHKANSGHCRPASWLTISLLVSLMMALTSNAPAQDPSESLTDRQFGPITPEHTLWRIASDNLPDESISIYQYMLALVESNPHAFIAGNANLMRSGVLLELPSATSARAVSADEARQRLRQQNEWFSARSREEIRAIRLGEVPIDTAPTAESTPATEPEPVFVAVPEAEVDTTPVVEPEPEPEPEPETASPQAGVNEAWDEIDAEIGLSTTAETDDPAEVDTTAESETDSGATREGLAEPAPQPPVVDANPVGGWPMAQTGSDSSPRFPIAWLLGLLGLITLAVLALLLWRRRSSMPAEPSASELTANRQAQPEETPKTVDSEAAAVAVSEAKAERDVVPAARTTEPEPAVSRPAKQPSAKESPPPPGLAEPEPADSWAELEASILNPPEPEPEPEPEPDADLDDKDWGEFVMPTDETELELGQATAGDIDTARPGEPEQDLAFDFEQLESKPVDDLVLSSDVDPDQEPDLDPAEDGLDLDFSFSAQTAEDTSQSAPAPDSAPLAESATEAQPSEAMSDVDAEISLDLARALAEGSDRDYARELLDEVIEKASEAMAARAREIRDAMN
jgi:FimV-like protein